MQYPPLEAEAHDLVSRFTEATSDLGTRPAGKLVGVSHDTVARWRKWVQEGSDPGTFQVPHGDTLRAVEEYLARASDIEMHRGALRLAADRLEDVVRQLRQEAAQPLPPVIPELSDAARVANSADETMKEARSRNEEASRQKRRA